MSLRSKAKAAREREKVKQAQALEAQKVAKEAERLKSLTSGFARTPRPANFKATKTVVMRRRSELEDIPRDHRYQVSELTTKVKVQLSEEMQARDEAAKAKLKEKSGRLLPAFNKGAYQYHTDEMLKDVASGANRRRN